MPIVVLGHRGMGPTSRVYPNAFLPESVAPENSLLAFQTAIDNGAQGIECDVYLTRDYEVVVSRDDVLDRNVDGYHSCWDAKDTPSLGKISEKDFVELQDLKYSLGHNQLTPSLKQVIDLIISNNKKIGRSKLKINVELQGDNLSLAQYTWGVIRSYLINPDNNLEASDFVINCFNLKHLTAFRQAQTDFAPIELFLGVYTSPLFGIQKLLPGWVPAIMVDGVPILKTEVDADYLNSLITLIKQFGINYLDLISADLRENLLQSCAQNNINISMAFNLVRARAEYELWNKDSSVTVTDAELEQAQLRQLFMFARQYPAQTFYYKADDVRATLSFLRILKLKTESEEKTAAKVEAEAYQARQLVFAGPGQCSPREPMLTAHRILANFASS